MRRITFIAALIGACLCQQLATAKAEERLDFCSFDVPFPEENLIVTGGSKSWSIRQFFVFRVTYGIPADFRGINPGWGGEDFSHIGDAELYFSSKGDVTFRSNFLVTQDDPRLPLDKVLESRGQTLVLALAGEGEGAQATALAQLTSQTAGNEIYHFASIKAPQAQPLVERLDAGLPFKLLIGAGTSLLASSDTLAVEDIAGIKATGELEFARMQAKAAAGTCM